MKIINAMGICVATCNLYVVFGLELPRTKHAPKSVLHGLSKMKLDAGGLIQVDCHTGGSLSFAKYLTFRRNKTPFCHEIF
jgi:hypothetical protein